MLRRNPFDKKYPLFSKYITDEQVRINMINNKDLFRKYTTYDETIRIFIFELEKRFDEQTISKFITEVILKLPDITMNSFIESYLNSTETSKSNKDVLLYYKNTASFGIEATKYMEKHGIVTNRSYKEIPNIIRTNQIEKENIHIQELNKSLTIEYNAISTGEEIFNGEPLKNIYSTLTVEEKQLVNKLLINNTFSRLDTIYERIDVNLKSLLNLYIRLGIDDAIINPNLLNVMNDYEFMILTLYLMTLDKKEIVDKIKVLATLGRYDLIKKLTIFDYIQYVNVLSKEEIMQMPDELILSHLKLIYDQFRPKVKEVIY